MRHDTPVVVVDGPTNVPRGSGHTQQSCVSLDKRVLSGYPVTFIYSS